MDAKITRKRLSDFLAYEWIVIIIAIAVGIFAWEAVFSLSGVKLTAGQTFNILYYKGVKPDTNLALAVGDDTFSYDMLGGAVSEDASYTDSTLYGKVDAFMADVLITTENNVCTIIDNRKVCDLGTLYTSAKAYVDYFYDGETINEDRVREKFLERLGKDNRFKTEEQKAAGVKAEIGRIEKLKTDVDELGGFLAADNDDLYFRYTRFKNVYENAEESSKETYRGYYETEIAEGRENLVYGLTVSNLKGGPHDATEYFKLEDGLAEDTEIVMILFDQREINGKENALFYEAVSFYCKVLKLCGNYIA